MNVPHLFVLAGGFGTRLQSVVSDVPKPLAPVNGHPFLYYQVKNWISQGLTSFVFLLHSKADMIIEFLENEQNGLLRFCTVKYLIEPEPMGTGGALAYAVQQLKFDESFLVTNADTWLGLGAAEIIECGPDCMAIINVDNSGRYGSVRITDEYITLFNEKSEDSSPGWINAGLCYLDSNTFKNWDGKPFSLEKTIFPALAIEGTLKAVKLKTDFIDIGVPADYQLFCTLAKNNNL
ncbi:sugar phosphate nucleotidyltransferase [Daejeonella sp. H1SJ63]|uniref:sugar phosphate nucleotidyltransferase n=1 Tax=Daejeonella sp. H1SJ63 TaxID=3034145 RepID=UPI0023EC3F62|nr:sugar phosphate nucleotidyltransferase [Daejeonella sp. H1SJ63]